jgi:hypothetical protein
MGKVNRNFKASVFSHLFGEPEKELELYNAFSDEPCPPGTPVTDLTLSDVLFMDRVNDLAFLVAARLVAFREQQSTINWNAPLRLLMYAGRVYERFADSRVMYSERRIEIPAPEFHVLYNGEKPFPDKTVLRLSDMYGQAATREAGLELVATVYNIGKGHNEDLVRRSESLSGYVEFVSMTRGYERDGMTRAKAVERAIRECISLGILAEYLKNNGSEVSNMLLQEWNWDDARAVWERDAEARGEARAETRADQKWQAVVADKDAALAGKDAEIARLKALLGDMKQ